MNTQSFGFCGGGASGNVASNNLKSGSQQVKVEGTNIEFQTPMPSINYIILWFCYNDNGEVTLDITNQTVDGFTVTPLENARFNYIAAPLTS